MRALKTMTFFKGLYIIQCSPIISVQLMFAVFGLKNNRLSKRIKITD